MTSPFVDRVEYQVIGRDTNASKVFRDVANAADDAGDSVDGLGGHIDRLNQNIDATAVRMRALIAAMRGISDVDLPAINGGDIDTDSLERANRLLSDLVVEVDRTGQATVRLGQELGGLDNSRDAITRVSTDFANLGRSIEDGRVVVIRYRDDLVATMAEGGREVDNVGTRFRNLSTDVETSRGPLSRLFADIRNLGTIDIAQRVEVGDSVVRTVSSNRDRLERAGLVAGATVGGSFLVAMNQLIGGGIGSIPIVGPMATAVIQGLSAISGPLGAAVAALMAVVAVAAAVTLTAALGAAILAAFAGGAIVTGIIGQLYDPAVKKAFSDTGDFLLQKLRLATDAFRPAIIESLLLVRSEVEKMMPQLQSMFETAATFVRPLTSAVLGFIREALPGMTRAMQSMQPVIDTLVQWAPKLGKTVGDFFERLGKNSDNLASGLGYVLGAANEAIKFFGILIELAAEAMAGVERLWNLLGKLPFAQVGEAAGDVLRGIQIKVGDLVAYMLGTPVQAAAKGMADGFKPLTKAKEYIDGVKDSTQKLADATRDAIKAANDFLGLGDAQSSMYEAMEAGAKRVASASKQDLAEGIDFATKAGRDNWKVLRDIAGSANRAASEITTMGGSASDAASVVQTARQSFIEVAGAMGIGAAEAQILADKMFGIPNADPTATLHDKASAGIAGITGDMNTLDGKSAHPSAYLDDNASGRIANVRDALRRLNGETAYVRVQASTPDGWNDFYGRASGGPIYGPGPKGVDSQLYMLAPGEHVLTAAEVDAAGGHHAIEAFRRSLLNKGAATPRLAGEPVRAGGASHVDGRTLGMALRTALAGMTLTIDDRTGRTAQLIARGG